MEATFEDVEDEGEGNDWLNFRRVAETQRVWFGPPPVQRVVERGGPAGIQRVRFVQVVVICPSQNYMVQGELHGNGVTRAEEE
jgi:hypothetical protein